ncbi:flagellar biosynthetic protein FliR [Hippea alviniae]|uniref:flagellar biosynthetic protein FliR n=1 Tax=Hippea alviniae TaxID=1279027 RepID=UPI0003B65CE5|nr:flagellar biosynthetic protein FliR [Hippea alviniae]
MNELITYTASFYGNFVVFLFILLRVSAIIVFAPVFSSMSIPPQVKMAFCFVFAAVIFPVVEPFINIHQLTALSLFAITVREILLATLLALTIHLIWSGIELGAQLVGYNMGFSIANVLSPEENTQISILAEFESIFAILVFLAVDGHYEFIKAMVLSFKVMPIGSFALNEPVMNIFIKLVSMLFSVAFSVLAPVIIALFITQVVFGLIARTMPQINIMIVAFPLNIAVGFLVLGAAFTFAANTIVAYYNEAFKYIYAILKVG